MEFQFITISETKEQTMEIQQFPTVPKGMCPDFCCWNDAQSSETKTIWCLWIFWTKWCLIAIKIAGRCNMLILILQDWYEIPMSHKWMYTPVAHLSYSSYLAPILTSSSLWSYIWKAGTSRTMIHWLINKMQS